MPQALIYAGIALLAILVIGLIWTRLYRRAPKDAALIRTGFGGEKVVINGGTMVIPFLHEIMPVSLTTTKLKVERTEKDSLLTLDKIRVDVVGQFHIRVAPNAEAISAAAQTLGSRINQESAVSDLVSAKLISSLRSVAATMTMDDLHANRVEFQQRVEKSLVSDLGKNGFELETVSITHFDQTNISHLNENNAFDAEGLTAISKITEDRKRLRNEIVAENRVAIERRNFEANQQSLQIAQQDEFATLDQRQKVENQRAETDALIAANAAGREQEAESARIAARQATLARQIEADKAEQLARQAQQIEIQNKSRDESVAKAEADEARAKAVIASEAVTTASETAKADRAKQIAVIEATQEAEQRAVGITVQAKAEKEAATNRAEAISVAAKAEADAITTKARGDADAEMLRADAAKKTFEVNAEGERLLIEARNSQTDESMTYSARIAAIEAMPKIIAEQVKPIAAIQSIKVVDVRGLQPGTPAGGSGGTVSNITGGSLAEQAVNGALSYRVNAPILDQLTRELFGEGATLDKPSTITSALLPPEEPAVAAVETPVERHVRRRRDRDDDDRQQLQG